MRDGSRKEMRVSHKSQTAEFLSTSLLGIRKKQVETATACFSHLVKVLAGLFSISTVIVSDPLKQVESQKQHLLLPTVSLKLLAKRIKPSYL